MCININKTLKFFIVNISFCITWYAEHDRVNRCDVDFGFGSVANCHKLQRIRINSTQNLGETADGSSRVQVRE